MPAWPIPIHQTKLTIAKPHAAGIRMPQIPTPLIISIVTTMFSSISSANAIRKPNTQPGVVPAREHDRADLIGYRIKSVARPDKRLRLVALAKF